MSRKDSSETRSGQPMPPREQDRLGGAGILIFGTIVFTVEAAIIREISRTVPVFEVVFIRAFLQLLLVALWCLARGKKPGLGGSRWPLMLARGLCSVGTWTFSFLMLKHLEFSLAMLLSFASALFVVVLAGPALGERVRLSSWIATFIGFAGIALASGIGHVTFNPAILWGVGMALSAAGVTIMNRSMSQVDTTETLLISISLIIMAASAPLTIMTWVTPDARTWLLLAATGVLSALAMAAHIEAYARAEAGFLAPITYLRLVFAIALGYFAFGEVPEWRMLAGAAIVVATTLYVTRSEQVRRKAAGKA